MKLLLINFLFFLSTFVWGIEIKICIWQGKERPSSNILKNFEKKYRGVLYIQKYNDIYFIINKIDIEEYLYGVVGKETDKNYPFEALKAQSICSRTIALKKIYENKEKNLPFDITSTMFHQVYGSCEDDEVIKSVEETKGEVLLYNDKIPDIFFHACCGGKTVSPSEIWEGSNILYIKGVDDPYCESSPYTNWERKFSKMELSKILDLQEIKEIKISEKDSSGRAKKVKIFLSNGKIIYLTGHQLRMNINSKTTNIIFKNPKLLPSTLFSIENTKDEIIFLGKGYGHGVGMCQWGAKVMAEKGFSYKEILSHYFPLLEIKNIY